MPSPTTLSISFTYLYDLNDAEEVKRAKAINEEWPRVQAEVLGSPPTPGIAALRYRLPPDMARQEIRKLGEYYKLLAKLKRTLDPNRIMNRGKLMDIEPY